VREAYKKRVPPALIFGVLMTENATFKSSARSNVGAVGLMQVYPKVWVPTLGKFFGKNLRDDETNLRYGVHILSHYVYRAASKSGAPAASSEGVLRTGLLRYNGCVRGTNTKDCHSYPDKVMRAVERYAVATRSRSAARRVSRGAWRSRCACASTGARRASRRRRWRVSERLTDHRRRVAW
jgi:soluble lytic murein transglycosylase-like protein